MSIPLMSSSHPHCRLAARSRSERVGTPFTIPCLFGALLLLLTGAVSPVNARITKITVSSIQSPTFGGASFGDAGQYEKLIGRAFGEVDPMDARNAVIADIALAPRNARGMVEYSMDVYILRPVDRTKGNRRLVFEINNRGAKLAFSGTFGSLNSAVAGGNDPTTLADAGNGFLMRQGHSIAWSGWDVTVAPGANRLSITVPTAKNADGSSIVGPALEEFVIDNSATTAAALTYAAANLDKAQATLTVRNHYSDVPKTVAASGWEYIDAQSIRLLPAGTAFQLGTLYEFTYQAKDPLISGLGMAAVRDFGSFLHWETEDENGTANPLAGNVEFLYSFGVSQPARLMHDFLWLGFNADEKGRRVFDGMENYIGGATGGFFNYRFAQPGRTHRQHIARWYPEPQFPFTNQTISDPVTGRTDGRLQSCQASDTCPKILEINSENEYWAKAGSLLHTDMMGNDLDLGEAPNTRVYLLSSLPHGSASGVGICQQPRNPVVADPVLRALLIALDDWVTWGLHPPQNHVPKQSDGTLVPSLPQEGVGFPRIPGVIYNGLLHTGDLLNFGPFASQGILTTLPPGVRDGVYAALVPKTDEDGNDVAGVRMPEIAAPLATYTGWGLRQGPAADDGCDGSGQQISFAQSKQERISKGDPRMSLEERYADHDGYVKAVRRAVQKLQREGFLLREDAVRYLRAAETSNVLR